MDLPERRGVEKTAFTDPVSGREIWRLTRSSVMADRHTYYDVNPWSPDGRQIVFSSARVEDVTTPERDLLYTNRGAIYLMDAETFEISPLAPDAHYQTHNGAFTAWHPDGSAVFFTHASGEIARVDVRTRQVQRIEGKMRQISPDGTTIVWTENHEVPLAERGVYIMGLDGSGARQIVSTQAVYDVTPNKDLFTVDEVTVGNTKWTPDSQHMLLTIWVRLFERPGQFSVPGIERSLYVANRDGSGLRWLTHFGHHHSWTPDARSVLYCDWLDPDAKRHPRLFLIDFDGTNKRVVIDEPLGGHPLMSPDGTRVVTWDDEGVILVDVGEGRSEHLATFGEGFDQSHRGTHPHPVWKADGSQILYNSAQTGHSQLYLLPMDQ
jgi:Tol biopolymer transport system component